MNEEEIVDIVQRNEDRRHCAKAVARHRVAVIAKASQSDVYGVLTHLAASTAQTWEHIAAMSGQGLEFAQDCNGLQG